MALLGRVVLEGPKSSEGYEPFSLHSLPLKQTTNVKNIRAPKVWGRILFHDRFINLSYRYRGSVARNQIHTNAKLSPPTTTLSQPKTLTNNRNELKYLKNKIIEYSAIKINVNPIAPYSMLNPETSSDSPSEKSNGVRLVSATHLIIQYTPTVGIITRTLLLIPPRILIFSDDLANSKQNSNSAKEISYEIVCATPRIAPKEAYFLFDDHPLSKRGYTPNPSNRSISTPLKAKDKGFSGRGVTDQKVSAKKIMAMGAAE